MSKYNSQPKFKEDSTPDALILLVSSLTTVAPNKWRVTVKKDTNFKKQNVSFQKHAAKEITLSD